MFNVIELTESFRQENVEFFNALNEIRIGKVSDKTLDLIMKRHFEVDHNINPNFIRLFFTNMEVDCYNSRKLMNIPSEGNWFHSKDVIKNSKTKPLFQIPISINIKIGAVVMLVKNINVEGLCNGTIGVVTFIEIDVVWFNINGKEIKIENVRENILDCTHSIIASRIGLPLQLGFSLTVHKAQGCTLNKAVLNFNSKIFMLSLPYVSLSRVKELNHLYIIHNNKNELRKILKNITIDKDVDFFYKNLGEKNFVTC
ncbi:ATP-dependent DNA helicase PIF1-like [Hydra vulgaris]|uniref:ATP-dependent DNA helicase PIF1-like n=1 Tax=Hydra vulgaris TaxID=6087 RepID=UPI0032EA6CDD